MPIDPRQLVTKAFPFASGFSEGFDSRMLPEGSLSLIENGVIDKQGTIKKRKGWDIVSNAVFNNRLPYTPIISNEIVRVFGSSGSLCYTDDKFIWQYTEELDVWVRQCEHGSMKGGRLPLARDANYAIRDVDSAYANGYVFSVYGLTDTPNDTGGDHTLYSAAVDPSNGEVLYPARLVSTNPRSNPQLFAAGDALVCVARYPLATDSLAVFFFNSAAPDGTWSAETTLSIYDNQLAWDACAVGPDTWCIARQTSATELTVALYDTTGALLLSDTQTVVSGDTVQDVAVCYDGTYIHVAWYVVDVPSQANTAVKWVRYSVALTPQASANISTSTTWGRISRSRMGVVADPATSRACVFWNDTSSTPAQTLMQWRGVDFDGTLHPTHNLPARMLTARPFLDHGEWHVLTQDISPIEDFDDSDPQSLDRVTSGSLVMLRIDPSAVVDDAHLSRVEGVYSLGDGVGMTTAVRDPNLFGTVPVRNTSSDGTKWYVAQAFAAELRQYNSFHYIGCNWEVLTLDPRAAGRDKVLSFGNAALILGGAPSVHDQRLAVFPGLVARPKIRKIEQSAGGGNLYAGANAPEYAYSVVVVWTDCTGRKYYSQPSLPVSFLMTTPNKNLELTIEVPHVCLNLDYSGQNLQYKIYRSLESSGNVLYLVDTLDVNPAATDFYTYTDSKVDDEIDGNEQVYWMGEFTNTHVPSASVGCVSGDRFWIRLDEQRNRGCYSKPHAHDRAPEFNVNIQYVDAPDAIEGMADLDGRPVYICKNAVYTVEGDGPGRGGAPPAQYVLRQVSGHVGTTQPMSVISTPAGVMFRGPRGFMLLDRGLSLRFEGIGDKIRKQSDKYPTVLEAVTVPEDGCVRFLCSGIVTEGDEDVERHVYLTWNWDKNEWALHDPVLSDEPVSIARVGNSVYSAAGSRIYKEGVGYGDDDTDGVAQFYAMVIETAWIRATLNGLHRLWHVMFLLRWMASHKLKISVAVGEKEEWVKTYTFDEAKTAAWGEVERPRIHVARQTSSAHKFRIEDLAPEPIGDDLSSVATQAYEANGFTVELGVKKGLLDVAVSQKGP